MEPPPLGLTARAVVMDHDHDGDTLPVQVYLPLRVRIRDCWAPDLRGGDAVSRSMGYAAQLHMTELLPAHTPINIHIPTEHARGPQSIMSFGRVLADVWRRRDNKSMASQMIEDGYAWATKAAQDAAIEAARNKADG